jgi:hypothetical protein
VATAADPPTGPERLAGAAAAVAALAVLTALVVLAFPDRSDYAGHLLAGAGATAMLQACLTFEAPDPRPNRILTIALLAVAAGIGTEATVFREAAFDPVDLALQSCGALLVSIPFLTGGGDRKSTAMFVAGLVMLIGGFGFAAA